MLINGNNNQKRNFDLIEIKERNLEKSKINKKIHFNINY